MLSFYHLTFSHLRMVKLGINEKEVTSLGNL
uniref:Uncharacterized protein n=1 Tax=Rhizophora mucronata TaxID=61149 RepID=A0A2P2PBF7_RHIMU